MEGYVWNALKDLTLLYDGRPFFFPRNDVTEVSDQVFRCPDKYKQMHPSSPDPQAMLETKIGGVEFARMLLNRQFVNYLDAGVWVGEKLPTVADKQMCNQKAEAYKRRMIDEALQ